MSRFSYYILVPAFVFGQFSTAEIQANLALRMALYMIVVTLGGVLISLIVAWLRGVAAPMKAAYVLIAAFGNVGNFGLPIIQFKLGDSGILPATFYFLIGITFGFIVGVSAATWQRGSGRGAIGSAFSTPGVVALLPALLFNGSGVAPPLFLSRAVSLLANAMVPVMLVTLGIQLAGMGRPKIFDADVMLISLVRLLAGPALAILLAAPFGLSGVERGAGIIQASMPAAVLTSLIALEHDLLPDFVTTTVLFSTLASAVTLTLVLALL